MNIGGLGEHERSGGTWEVCVKMGSLGDNGTSGEKGKSRGSLVAHVNLLNVCDCRGVYFVPKF